MFYNRSGRSIILLIFLFLIIIPLVGAVDPDIIPITLNGMFGIYRLIIIWVVLRMNEHPIMLFAQEKLEECQAAALSLAGGGTNNNLNGYIIVCVSCLILLILTTLFTHRTKGAIVRTS